MDPGGQAQATVFFGEGFLFWEHRQSSERSSTHAFFWRLLFRSTAYKQDLLWADFRPTLQEEPLDTSSGDPAGRKGRDSVSGAQKYVRISCSHTLSPSLM